MKKHSDAELLRRGKRTALNGRLKWFSRVIFTGHPDFRTYIQHKPWLPRSTLSNRPGETRKPGAAFWAGMAPRHSPRSSTRISYACSFSSMSSLLLGETLMPLICRRAWVQCRKRSLSPGYLHFQPFLSIQKETVHWLLVEFQVLFTWWMGELLS